MIASPLHRHSFGLPLEEYRALVYATYRDLVEGDRPLSDTMLLGVQQDFEKNGKRGFYSRDRSHKYRR